MVAFSKALVAIACVCCTVEAFAFSHQQQGYSKKQPNIGILECSTHPRSPKHALLLDDYDIIMPPPLCLIQLFWNVMTSIGLRRVARFLQRIQPVYRDTIFYFEQIGRDTPPPPKDCIALTIDDGLSRGGTSTSMVRKVCQLLQKYQAHATFFVCTEYTNLHDARFLLEYHHELGNHLERDVSGYYNKMDRETFQAVLQKTNNALDEMDGGNVPIRWFRAPQAILTTAMWDAVQAHGDGGMRHILGDVYCDDWAFAESSSFDDSSRVVARLMSRQVHRLGSVAVFHMPESGFRESGLDALENFLQIIEQKSMRCITLSEMARCSQRPFTLG